MLYVDLPSAKDIAKLHKVRSKAAVSIYLPTTPITQDTDGNRIELGNLLKDAIAQAQEAGIDKKAVASLEEHINDLREDDEFWRFQAHSLAILATPERIWTYRLANTLTASVEVSDRFHLKPLLRAVTFPNSAHVLALSENGVRLVEISADLPPSLVKVDGLPKDAASAVGKSTINDRSASRRIQGSEGQKVRLAQYVRQIDAALRPILGQSDIPLILAATQPMDAIFRSVSSLNPLDEAISGSPDRLSEQELAEAARPVLDADYAKRISDLNAMFEARAGARMATTDFSDAARAATFGAIDTLLVDIDSVVDGYVDDETGAITLDEGKDAKNYCILDEIAARALSSGATVLAVRESDIPGGKKLAAILRRNV
ncbi:MAG TPA: hypothetical protein VNS12_12370 [Pelagibacterium sp.]|uniref:baeRF11 domain-containing protein n=1 Tax=Pelagibacterium sp. TaxID=1967288 RepID=UPI002C257896|nr:hypothetical protein [Pelagibacterium sp.]HWJ88858.1 hypothetical protein [Pelagibacterium sp.]